MKKMLFLGIATLAMLSCGNSYKTKTVELTNMNDSVNYALGLANGAQLKMYQLREDSSKAVIDEFLTALDKGYNSKDEVSELQSIAKNVAGTIKTFEKKGLVENPLWQLNEKLLFQGLVNALNSDTTVFKQDEAGQYFQSHFSPSQNDSVEAAKPIRAKCGKKVATPVLNSEVDSLNYCFGYIIGSELNMFLIQQADTTGEGQEELIAAINKSMKESVINAQTKGLGEQIGRTIKEQEAQGLIGVEQLTTDFPLILQGFINGIYGFNDVMDPNEAGMYIQTSVQYLKYGAVKEQGELFLKENALKEGVIVTESGLQYEILTMGKGKKPAATDRVKVHYHGTLIDGTVFDSSVDRGEPITFGLNQVIAGWTEGVQLMPVGSKFRFYIPQELGYGAREAGKIPPYSTLIFEVELLGIEK